MTRWTHPLLATLGLFACAVPDVPATATQAPPPTPGFLLLGPAVALPGSQPSVDAYGVPPNALTGLLGSPASAGAPYCPAPLGGCSDLVGNGAVLGADRADGGGHVTFVLPVLPAFLAGRTVSLQAARPSPRGPKLSTILSVRVVAPGGDEDGDGLTNEEELNTYGTDPLSADSDGGGVTDLQELLLGTDPGDVADDSPIVEPDMAVGWLHTCRQFVDGSVLCNGSDSYGQSSPPAGLWSFDLAAGQRETCAADQRGDVTCWGEHGTYVAPVQRAVNLAHSDDLACAVDLQGAVSCWTGTNPVATALDGDTFFRLIGQPGDICGQRPDLTWSCVHTDLSGTALDVPLLDLEVASQEKCGTTTSFDLVCLPGGVGLAARPEAALPYVDVEVSHELPVMCGRHPDDTVTCWFVGLPTFLPALEDGPPALAAFDLGAFHGCGITPTSEPICWGPDVAGAADVPAASPFVALDGGYANCGLRADGSVDCFTFSSLDMGLPAPADRFVTVATGVGHSCGVRLDGTLACWGTDQAGGTATIPPAGADWTDVAAGFGASCALDSAQHVTCWGGILPADPFPGEVFVSIEGGGVGVCGLRLDGSARCADVDITTGLLTIGTHAGPYDQLDGNTIGYAFEMCGRVPGGGASCLGVTPFTSPPGDVYDDIAFGLLTIDGVPGGPFVAVLCGLRPDGSTICRDPLGVEIWSSAPGQVWTDMDIGTQVCGIETDGSLSCASGEVGRIFSAEPVVSTYVHRVTAAP